MDGETTTEYPSARQIEGPPDRLHAVLSEITAEIKDRLKADRVSFFCSTAKIVSFGRPFVALNCAALPDNLVEAELFGIERGVATGVERRTGKFEAANRGTLFLDEIGDLNLTAQAKLLRALQERAVDRVGTTKPIPIDIRIIAATNRDLLGAIREKQFREDLYYRVKVIRIQTPPLRESPRIFRYWRIISWKNTVRP